MGPHHPQHKSATSSKSANTRPRARKKRGSPPALTVANPARASMQVQRITRPMAPNQARGWLPRGRAQLPWRSACGTTMWPSGATVKVEKRSAFFWQPPSFARSMPLVSKISFHLAWV
eukprot:14187256-Alexandrium_andersonii.AAC.2